MLSYEYVQFLNEKILEFLPPGYSRIGNKINLRCPICGDSHKSATKKRGWYYLHNASYYCFNCSIGLSGIKFLEAISGSSYDDIRKEYTRLFLKSGKSLSLSADIDADLNDPNLFTLKSIIKPNWKNPLTEKAIDYLENRKVMEAPFFDQHLFSCFNKAKTEEFILIPWVVNGVEAYYQVNDFLKLHSMKYIFPKDQKKLVYGLDNIDMSWPYIIAFEGVYDSLFVKNGIAVGTKAITDYQLKMIKDRYPRHQIVISFDNDAAGLDSMMRLLKKENDFKYFRWFNKNTQQKDINDYVLFKDNVNMFSDPAILEKMIVDKLVMKMYLIQNGMWKADTYSKPKFAMKTEDTYGTSSFWKTRKI